MPDLTLEDPPKVPPPSFREIAPCLTGDQPPMSCHQVPSGADAI